MKAFTINLSQCSVCSLSPHGISQVTQNNKTNPSHKGNFPLEYKLSLLFSSALFGPVRAKKINFELIHCWKPADSALYQHHYSAIWWLEHELQWGAFPGVSLCRKSFPSSTGKAGNVLWNENSRMLDTAEHFGPLSCLLIGLCQDKGSSCQHRSLTTPLSSLPCQRSCGHSVVSPPQISIPSFPLFLASFQAWTLSIPHFLFLRQQSSILSTLLTVEHSQSISSPSSCINSLVPVALSSAACWDVAWLLLCPLMPG